jgi:acetolactate decarboxylase
MRTEGTGTGDASTPDRRVRPAVLRRASAAAAAVLLLAGGAPAAAASGPDWVDQVGTYDYLTAPDFDGLAPVASSVAGRTLGLGTFDHLDGELVLVGGVPYRVGVDGVPQPAPAGATTPFLEAIRYVPDASGPVAPGTTCASLQAAVDALAATDDGIVAVRVRGTFASLVTRSVPAQAQPYPALAQAVAGQTVFDLGRRRAVLVGFRTGPDLAGVGAPGLHLHAVTADRSAGGHVLSCVAGDDVQLSVQRAAGVRVTGRQ